MTDPEPTLSPVGLEEGDRLQTAFSVLRVLDRRGEYTDEGDEREWFVRDEDTGEELWVDFRFLTDASLSNLGPKHGSGWDENESEGEA